MTKAQEKNQDAGIKEAVAEVKVEVTKPEQADGVVRKYMLWSMAAGIAPVIVDTIAVTGVQLKMLHQLAKIYEVPFSKNAGKSIVASMIGGISAGSISRGGLGMALKMIPMVGPVVGGIAMPVLAGGSTYAIGKLFTQHFESGGTFLNFEPAKMREPFADLYKEGKSLASRVHIGFKPGKTGEEAVADMPKEAAEAKA